MFIWPLKTENKKFINKKCILKFNLKLSNINHSTFGRSFKSPISILD